MRAFQRLDVQISPMWFAIATEWHRRDLVEANDAKDAEDARDELDRELWPLSGPHRGP